MSSSLYQTFYPYNKFDDVKSICQLEKWMLVKDVLAQLSARTPENGTSTGIRGFSGETTKEFRRMDRTSENNAKTSPISVQIKQTPHFIIPDKMDTLFWCLYISYYGEDKYLAIGNKYGNAEIAERQQIMEFLKSNKNVLKNLNRKITIGATQEIMSDLMTNMKTTLLSLVAFSVYYKKNILLLNTCNKTFLEYTYDVLEEPRKWIVIKYMENKQYGFFAEEMDDITTIVADYIHIEYPDKPMKGISTYKIGELSTIASKIPELAKEPKLSKQELYGRIWQSLLWK
jgi:hypothetical protein